jgi:hypothetical protein
MICGTPTRAPAPFSGWPTHRWPIAGPYAGPISSLEEGLGRLQRENHAPHAMTLANALQEFRREVERGRLRTLACELPPANGSTPATFNIPEFALGNNSWRAADILRAWPAWPPALVWNAATASSWQMRSGIPKGWLKTLPADHYLPLAEVVKFLAFGPRKIPIGLSQVEEQAEKLRAARSPCLCEPLCQVILRKAHAFVSRKLIGTIDFRYDSSQLSWRDRRYTHAPN